MRPVFVTRCLHCLRRLHAPSEEKLNHNAMMHARNCNAYKQALRAAHAQPQPEREDTELPRIGAGFDSR